MSGSDSGTARHPNLLVTTHAAERWATRVRSNPDLTRAEAEADLVRCARVAEMRTVPPPWLLIDEDTFDQSRYLMCGDDVAIVAVPIGSGRRWAATTVVTRSDAGSVQVARQRSARHRRMFRQRERSPRRAPTARRPLPALGDLDD